MQDFRIRVGDFDKVLKEALAQTYAYCDKFANESDFKHELFHQLHGMKINGHKLGDKLPGCPTSMLHAEAKPVNGLKGKGAYADLLICNPTIQHGYNYRADIVIELKTAISTSELRREIAKFSEYSNSVRNLYIASANKLKPRANEQSINPLVSELKPLGTSIVVLDRSSIPYTSVPQSCRRSKGRIDLAGCVANCIKDTLRLYGNNRSDANHSFFWRNYEHEDNKGWTFPCEGDFVAQLYHCVRETLGKSAVINTEYRPLSVRNRKVDLFVQQGNETVGIEVKMNYDNFKGDETAKLSEKFNAMNKDNNNHTNFLVVIQGQHAHKSNNKANTLRKLQQSGAAFSMLYYAEHDKNAIGPVSVEEAQELSMR